MGMKDSGHKGPGRHDDMIIIYNNLHMIGGTSPGLPAFLVKVGAGIALYGTAKPVELSMVTI